MKVQPDRGAADGHITTIGAPSCTGPRGKKFSVEAARSAMMETNCSAVFGNVLTFIIFAMAQPRDQGLAIKIC